MIRPSIQARHALARLTLPVMVIAAFGLMLVGKVDTVLVERARIAVYDASAPIYAALAEPFLKRTRRSRMSSDYGACGMKTPVSVTRTNNSGVGSRSR